MEKLIICLTNRNRKGWEVPKNRFLAQINRSSFACCQLWQTKRANERKKFRKLMLLLLGCLAQNATKWLAKAAFTKESKQASAQEAWNGNFEQICSFFRGSCGFSERATTSPASQPFHFTSLQNTGWLAGSLLGCWILIYFLSASAFESLAPRNEEITLTSLTHSHPSLLLS